LNCILDTLWDRAGFALTSAVGGRILLSLRELQGNFGVLFLLKHAVIVVMPPAFLASNHKSGPGWVAMPILRRHGRGRPFPLIVERAKVGRTFDTLVDYLTAKHGDRTHRAAVGFWFLITPMSGFIETAPDTLYRISEADETLCKRSLQNVAASIGDHVTDTI